MNKAELYNAIQERKIKSAEILDKIANEKRELSNVEKLALDTNKNEIAGFEDEIKKIDNTPAPRNLKVGENRERFSLAQTLRDFVDGNEMSDISKQTIARGKQQFAETRGNNVVSSGQIVLPVSPIEKRTAIQGTTEDHGEETIQTDIFNLLGALLPVSVLLRSGATYLGGLKTNLQIPKYAGTTVGWGTTENSVIAADGGGEFSDVGFQPHRLTGFVDVSKQLLLEDVANVDAVLMKDLGLEINAQLEGTLLGTGQGAVGAAPQGLFYNLGTTGYSYTGTTSWTAIVGLESTVAAANVPLIGPGCGYIFHPTTKGILKTTPKASSYPIFIWDNDDEVNGYSALATSNMPTVMSSYKAAVFGNFSFYFLCQWGGVDILVDTITQALYGNIRLVISSYWDGGPVRSNAFALASLD